MVPPLMVRRYHDGRIERDLVLEREKSIADSSILVRSDASASSCKFVEKKRLWESCSSDVTRIEREMC
ncbi:unnamed protein product [Larinioides sclopetarius]|uniref:Uncharacterized protein n=1 Tax=Larinioides sclopetarius TaxID=280406 RepID=A0AAV1ZJK5_9ARAC